MPSTRNTVRIGPKAAKQPHAAPDTGRKTRLNLSYRGDEVEKLLDKLQTLGHHGSVTDTVARALRVYEALLDERAKGNTVIVRDEHGTSILRLI